MSHRKKSILILSIIVGVVLLYGYYYANYIKENRRNELTESLVVASNAKLDRLNAWKTEKLHWLSFVSKSPDIIKFLEKYNSSEIDVIDSAFRVMQINELLEMFEKVSVVSKNGHIVHSRSQKHHFLSKNVDNNVDSKLPTLGFYNMPEFGGPIVKMTMPIFSANDSLLGVVVGFCNPEKNIYPILNISSITAKSTETYLCCTNDTAAIMILSPLKILAAPVFSKISKSVIAGTPMEKVFAGETGICKGFDLNGNKVIAYISYLDDNKVVCNAKFAVVTEVQEAEVLKTFQHNLNLLLFVVFIIIVFVAIIFVINTKSAQSNLQIQLEKQNKLLKDSLLANENMFYENPKPSLVYNVKTKCFVKVNKAACKAMEYTEIDFIGKSILDVVPREEHDYFLKLIEKSILGTDDLVLRWHVITKSGQKLVCERISSQVIDPEKGLRMLVLRDVTEFVRISSTIKDMEDWQRKFEVLLPDAYYVSQNGSIVQINSVGVKLFGAHDARELIGISSSQLYGRNNYEKYMAVVNSLENGNCVRAIPLTIENLHGRVIEVELSAVSLRLRGEMSNLVYLRDVSEQIRNKKSNLERRQHFCELAKCGIKLWTIDVNVSSILFYRYNEEKEDLQIIDVKKEDWLGRIHPEDLQQYLKNVSEALKNHSPLKIEYRLLYDNSEYRWSMVSGIAIYDDAGNYCGYAGHNVDIQEMKHLQSDLDNLKNSLDESEKLRTAFLANVSHEIRTPMNVIVGYADLIALKNMPLDKVEKYTSMIRKSSKRLLNIVNDMTNLAKIDNGQMLINSDNVNLNQFMVDLYNELRMLVPAEKEIKLNMACPQNLNVAVIDQTKLQQIVCNLVINSMKYTISGEVNFGYEIIGKDIVIKVTDTGVGIPVEDQQYIFKRFSRIQNTLTAKELGLGLGLSIVKAYVDMLGGTISVKSEIGVGSEFTVTIPFVAGEASSVSTIFEIPKSLDEEKSTILVVEDNDSNFIYVNELLQINDYKVERAANGQEAVEFMSKNNNIKLVLMDIMMPKMNGYEAITKIREINPTIPVVAQTAFVLDANKEKFINYGFNGYLAKPIREDELLRLLAELID